MQPIRRARLEAVILEELSKVVPRELKDPRISSITFTSCTVTPDGSQATVLDGYPMGKRGEALRVPEAGRERSAGALALQPRRHVRRDAQRAGPGQADPEAADQPERDPEGRREAWEVGREPEEPGEDREPHVPAAEDRVEAGLLDRTKGSPGGPGARRPTGAGGRPDRPARDRELLGAVALAPACLAHAMRALRCAGRAPCLRAAPAASLRRP